MDKPIEVCLEKIFTNARTYSKFLNKPVSDEVLENVYNQMRFGPTSANSCPLRIIFLRSEEAKERLKPHLWEGNVSKTMAAPATALFAYDLQFYERLPVLFPYANAKVWFEDNKPFALESAFRNSSLQAAYFILAARALGLDCGPMSGFNNEGVDKEFFPDGRCKSNFLCNLGYGDPEGLVGPRAPRLSFEETCKII